MHTPLPWKADGRCVIGADNALVCECNMPPGDLTRTAYDDAELIARAVSTHADLLAACKLVLEWQYGSAIRDDDALNAVSAAIAKAESR